MSEADPRRKLIAEAMDAIENGWHKESHVGPPGVRRYIEESSRAIPAAVELIEELTAEVASQRDMFNLTRHRVIERMGEPDLGKSWSWIESTIATQAKEIERLRGLLACNSINHLLKRFT